MTINKPKGDITMKKIFQAFILAQVVLYSALASATTTTTTKCKCGGGSPTLDGCTQPNTGCYRHGKQCDTLKHAKGKPGHCKTISN